MVRTCSTVTNGDGPVHRNVLDGTTDDPLAYSARVNWDIKGHMGYEEGALRQTTCELGRRRSAPGRTTTSTTSIENPLVKLADRLTWGVDARGRLRRLLVHGGLQRGDVGPAATSASTSTATSWLVQVGYLFPDTAWEIAARYDAYTHDFDGGVDLRRDGDRASR